MAIEIYKQISEVIRSYPELVYDENTCSISGFLKVAENDSYQVRIDVRDFPEKFPVVYEIGERIPSTMNRHKYSDSDACCLTTPAKAQILLKTKVTTLHEFINLLVIPYFRNNSFYEINKRYVHGEHSHGSVGIVEGYLDILGIENPLLIEDVINHRLLGFKLKIYDLCYCRSGKILKKCSNHDSLYREFRLIDVAQLKIDLELISPILRLLESHLINKWSKNLVP